MANYCLKIVKKIEIRANLDKPMRTNTRGNWIIHEDTRRNRNDITTDEWRGNHNTLETRCAHDYRKIITRKKYTYYKAFRGFHTFAKCPNFDRNRRCRVSAHSRK